MKKTCLFKYFYSTFIPRNETCYLLEMKEERQ